MEDPIELRPRRYPYREYRGQAIEIRPAGDGLVTVYVERNFARSEEITLPLADLRSLVDEVSA